MRPLANIVKKELRELLTPGSVISIVVVVLMLCSLGVIMGGEIEHATKLSPVGVVNGDSGEYGNDAVKYIKECYINSGVKMEEIDDYVVILSCDYNSDAIIKAMQDKGLKNSLAIKPGFSSDIANGVKGTVEKYYIYANGGMMSATSSAISDTVLEYVNAKTSLKLIDGHVTSTMSPAFLRAPVAYNKDFTCINGHVYDGITPGKIAQATMSQSMMVPIIMMIVIMMVGSIVISSMGNEKENKTLETLLTLPVNRTTIVSGKLIASALMGLVYGMAYMLGMSVYLGSMMVGGAGINLADYGLSLTLADWALISVSVFLSILCALGICMILGAFVKNYKAAQTMTLPISILAMIPMFVTMFSGWDALPAAIQALMFAIPFSHPMMAANNLLFGNIGLVLGGIVYMAIFSIATIAITVRIYKSDLLITGIGSTKIGAMFSKMGKKKHAD
ncbi:MAG: ABC transporter permease [Candidatus Methanomethylophilaceae archaeon]|nr:ABC transporter permease [Candidatus Methanomethylophilaceae archaeon]